MPKEGHKSITMAVYRIERVQKYYDLHEAELRKRGIKSASALIGVWVDEKLIESR